MKLTKIFRTGLSLAFTCVVLLQWNGYVAEKDGGVVAYPNRSGTRGPALFSHLSHGAREAGFYCNQCHVDASTRKLTVTMDEINQGKACGACHDGKTKGPRAQRAASPVQDCTACHMPSADIVIKLNRMDPVAFSHIRHLGVDSEKKVSKPIGFSCIHCHPELFERASKASYGMEVPHESGACAKCHNGQKRKDGLPSAFAANTRCLTCHKPPASSSSDTQ
jgi:c(7)-type cytochrome triheme protein